jgi:hypothetical protein
LKDIDTLGPGFYAEFFCEIIAACTECFSITGFSGHVADNQIIIGIIAGIECYADLIMGRVWVNMQLVSRRASVVPCSLRLRSGQALFVESFIR